MAEIMKFRSREAAKQYIKFQRDNGNKMNGATVIMKKCLGHKWANRVGNVATIRTGRDPGGNRYLFTDGYDRYDYQDREAVENARIAEE